MSAWRCAWRAACAALALAAGCAAPALRPASPCPRPAAPDAAICARDSALQAFRARFRATVSPTSEAAASGAASRSAEGLMLLEPPRAMRVKLFTLGGITVLDALWVGAADGSTVHGWVRSPLRGTQQDFELRATEPLTDPDAAMSFALWSLWQARCAAPPRPVDGAAGRFALDPTSAHARRREVEVEGGEVREELLVRPARAGADTDTGVGGDATIVARFADYDCALATPLARDVTLLAPEQGWRAEVHIIEVAADDSLDPQLFAIPSSGQKSTNVRGGGADP